MTEPSVSAASRSPVSASFPSPLTGGRSNTPSIISSRMTDIASEDENNDDQKESVYRPGTATSNHPPYRPGSSMSSHTRPSVTTSPVRRGLGSPGSLNALRGGGGVLGIGGSNSDRSRPGTSASKASRTHVTNLTSQAFFNPMSSQRLQAQRSARPSKRNLTSNPDPTPITSSSTRRNSLTSNPTEYPSTVPRDEPAIPPPTRGTEFSAPDDRMTSASPDGKYTFRSYGGSERPLKQSLNGTMDSRAPNGMTESDDAHSFVKPPITSNQQPGHNYQYFAGNTFFFLGGRAQNTRDRPINLASALLVIVPSVLFLIFSGPYLSDHVSPAIPVLYAYLFYICISSFAHASLTDPGILPRNLHQLPPPESEDPLAVPPPLTQWTMIKTAGTANAAMDVPTKYCKTCNIWRPPRCHHCRICDNCIETQDHHCVWINNCVGRRNYRYFFSFICSGTMLGIFLIGASIGHCLRYASDKHISFGKSINTNRVPFAMFIYGILITAYPVCLWGYHLWLIARGETTREYLNSHKFLKKDRHRPFTQGSTIKNWITMLVRPRTPTYLRFKSRYEAGDQRFGPRRGPGLGPGSGHGKRIRGKRDGGVEMQDVAVVRHATPA